MAKNINEENVEDNQKVGTNCETNAFKVFKLPIINRVHICPINGDIRKIIWVWAKLHMSVVQISY